MLYTLNSEVFGYLHFEVPADRGETRDERHNLKCYFLSQTPFFFQFVLWLVLIIFLPLLCYILVIFLWIKDQGNYRVVRFITCNLYHLVLNTEFLYFGDFSLKDSLSTYRTGRMICNFNTFWRTLALAVYKLFEWAPRVHP